MDFTGEKLTVPELFDRFAQLAEVTSRETDSRGIPIVGEEASLLIRNLENDLVGRRIKVEELPIARQVGERAIGYWTEASNVPRFGRLPITDRYHPRTMQRYTQSSDPFLHTRRSKGIIEAVDGVTLVVRPNFARLWKGRHWVKLLSDEGQPLVDITFPERTSA